MARTFTYDLSTNVGRMRRTIPDNDDEDFLWSDEELQSFIDDEGDWRRATALALETMASDSAYTLQVIKIQQLSTNGAETARALLNRATQLRSQAEQADANEEGGFDIIEMVHNDFTFREQVYKSLARSE